MQSRIPLACLHLNRNLLETCPAFKDADPGCLRTLSMRFKTTHAPAGDTLVHRGDLLLALYFVSKGSLEVLIDERTVVAILSKGDVFGETVRRTGAVGKASATVRSLTPCDMHKITRADLMEVLAMYPEFAEKFWKNLKITYDLHDESTSPIYVDEAVIRSSSRAFGAPGPGLWGGQTSIDDGNMHHQSPKPLISPRLGGYQKRNDRFLLLFLFENFY